MHVLAFGVAVLLASAVGASPTGSHHDALLFNLVARGNATTSNPNYLPGGLLNPILFNLTNATSPAPGAILTADLEGITLTLPWWSSLPGALLDLAIGLKAVSLDWVGVSHGGEKGGLLKGQRTLYQRAWMALHVVEQGYMLVQALAGFAHLAQNADRRDYVRYGGPGVYALLFGATCKLWITKVLLSYPSLAAAWVTALCSLAAFLLLSLPPTGEAPLYRLRSPWAVVPTGYGPNATTFDYRPFWIAPGPDPLGIYSNAMLPKYWVNVFFAAVMGLMLLATLFRQLQFHVFKRELQFRQKWVGHLMYLLTFAAFFFTLIGFIEAGLYQKQCDYMYAVCVGTPNNTNLNMTNHLGSCTNVSVVLPELIGDLPTALGLDNSNLARLIFNV